MSQVMCAYQGCVAEAVAGGSYCAVHVTRIRESDACPWCHGAGQLSIEPCGTVVVCQKCCGVGIHERSAQARRVARRMKKVPMKDRGIIRLLEQD